MKRVDAGGGSEGWGGGVGEDGDGRWPWVAPARRQRDRAVTTKKVKWLFYSASLEFKCTGSISVGIKTTNNVRDAPFRMQCALERPMF